MNAVKITIQNVQNLRVAGGCPISKKRGKPATFYLPNGETVEKILKLVAEQRVTLEDLKRYQDD